MIAPWRAVRVEACSNRDAVIATLFDLGSKGIQEDGDAIVTHFPPDVNTDDVVAAVRGVDDSALVGVTDAPVVNWSEWRASVGAHRVGKLVVTPPWLAHEYDPASSIVIDPAMAFGTGEHPTTRGMLRLMQGIIRPSDSVADLGAGSAVLSIAAVKLGASRVAAIERDPDSQETAEENIRVNGVQSAVHFLVGDATVLLPLVAPVRVILANIVSSVLMELLPSVVGSLTREGHAIFGGILVEERQTMLGAFARSSLQLMSEDVEGDWWTAAVERLD